VVTRDHESVVRVERFHHASLDSLARLAFLYVVVAAVHPMLKVKSGHTYEFSNQ